MMIKKLHPVFLLVGLIVCNSTSAQLYIGNGTTMFIQPGATVTVQGDLTSGADIQGSGKLLLKGTAAQNVNMNGFGLPLVEIDNAANATLTGNAKINTGVLFTAGKIILGTNNLSLADVATVSGQGTGKFLETNSTGQVIKLLTADVTDNEIPLGLGTNYRPAFITSAGTYTSASVGVKVLGVADPNRPPMIADYLLTHWPVTKTGITGSLTVAGQYIDAADISGNEITLKGYYFDGTDWSSAGEAHDIALNKVSAPVTSATGDLYGMDKFVLVKTKVFLQGAYNSTLGLMSDALRTPTNLIPLTDPYRNAPFNFTQIDNPIAETADVSVFNNQANANDNIVDWVFVELRSGTPSPGNVVYKTRSALLKRDGNIVDVDGVSPVTFSDIFSGSYTIAVRHRNHLGISSDPANTLVGIDEKKSTASLFDFTTTSDANIYGPSAAYNVLGGKNVMWAGNANFNTNVRFIGLGNDKDYILVNTLGNNAGLLLKNVYSSADLNMNRNVSFVGLGNDKDLILVNVLANVTTAVKNQALPN
jgi:hypothetical protein